MPLREHGLARTDWERLCRVTNRMVIHRRCSFDWGVRYLCYIESYVVDNLGQPFELTSVLEVVGV